MNRQNRRHPDRCKIARRGFSIVEALAAGMILAISAAAVTLTVRQAVRSLTMARDYQIAAELTDRTLTKIDTLGPGRILREGPTSGNFSEPNDRFAWEAAIDQRLDGHLYDVTVKITWQVGGASRLVEVQTFLNDPNDTDEQDLLPWEDL